MAAPGDLASAAQAHAVVQTAIKAFSGLDVLVNNAGVYADGPIEGVTKKTYDWMMNIHVKGVFFATQAAIPELRRNKGCVVMADSEYGFSGNKNSGLYGTKKVPWSTWFVPVR